jgi:hypothetical protein
VSITLARVLLANPKSIPFRDLNLQFCKSDFMDFNRGGLRWMDVFLMGDNHFCTREPIGSNVLPIPNYQPGIPFT